MITRRQLLWNAAATAFLGQERAFAERSQPTVLKLCRQIIEVNGKPAPVYAIVQPNGRHGIILDYGLPFYVRVENELDEASLIHWHGLTPPSDQDGVPGISGPVIPARGAATYQFSQPFGGTHWMHSHYKFQEQQLLSAPLIIRYPNKYTEYQDIVVMLADFSFRAPQEIFASLTAESMLSSGFDQSKSAGHEKMHMNNSEMTMMHVEGHQPSDLNDVAYDAFLANRRTLDDPEVIALSKEGRVLLRVINGATMSNFHVNLGEIIGQLVAVDGQETLPVSGRSFPIAAGQRLDILLSVPVNENASPVFFQLEGDRRRSGIILAHHQARVVKQQSVAEDYAPPIDLSLERILHGEKPLIARPAERFYSLDLTGDMTNYVWSINNVVWTPSSKPFPLRKGERVEVTITNKTMMAHPMHLHGHRFQVVEINNQRFTGAVRDTIHVPPGDRVVIAFDADNPGVWAFHCHLAYHMHAGMFATFQYL